LLIRQTILRKHKQEAREKTNQKIIARLQAGEPIAKIADDYGLSINALHQLKWREKKKI
jgi:hypothetical protein